MSSTPLSYRNLPCQDTGKQGEGIEDYDVTKTCVCSSVSEREKEREKQRGREREREREREKERKRERESGVECSSSSVHYSLHLWSLGNLHVTPAEKEIDGTSSAHLICSTKETHGGMKKSGWSSFLDIFQGAKEGQVLCALQGCFTLSSLALNSLNSSYVKPPPTRHTVWYLSSPRGQQVCVGYH